MQITGISNTTYILLNGLYVSENVILSKNIELLPADTSHIDFSAAVATCSHPEDIAVIIAFIPRITAQLKISAPTSKEAAVLAWNSSWDVLLLSAIVCSEIGFNIQSDVEAGKISSKSNLRATNYNMYGLKKTKPYKLESTDIAWISNHYQDARQLLDSDKFQTAVHCLASYRWHSIPRIKMAILWAGIEGLFGASSEIRFRISLYISRFLHPLDIEARKITFNAVKKLYNYRSSAVHGSKVKKDLPEAVEESAELLKNLIQQCAINKKTPDEDELVP